MKRLFLISFSLVLSINITAQQGGTFGFEFTTIDRNYNSESNSENIYLFDYTGQPLKALQFKIIIKTGLEYISNISLNNGIDVPENKFLFDYNIHNKSDGNGNLILEISAVVLGKDYNELKANNKYHLASIKYDIYPSLESNCKVDFSLIDVEGATSTPVNDAKIKPGNNLAVLLIPKAIKFESTILNQNFPNPFNPNTTISWQSPVSGVQKIVVYDALGKEITTLANEYLEEGTHKIDFKNESLSSGIYFYQLIINCLIEGKEKIFSETKRMIYLK